MRESQLDCFKYFLTGFILERRKKMTRKDESIFNLVTRLPWWVGICLGILSFLFFKYFFSAISFHNPILKGFSAGLSGFSPVIALLFFTAAGISVFNSIKRSGLIEKQKDLDTLGQLSWREFEQIVGEAFRRRGYFVLENPGVGADGGVDLRLRKNGKKVYVQCKNWKSRRVGVSIVRELYGVMRDKDADEGVVVTYGSFTPEAHTFAKGKPIQLIGGSALIQMIKEVQANPPKIDERSDTKICPECGSEMIIRTAKKGKYAGQKFWGCSNFPKCRTIIDISDL